jgi:uncharacterized membrane protein YjgN (DUF898 family)
MNTPPSPPAATIGLAGLTRPQGQEGDHPRVERAPAVTAVPAREHLVRAPTGAIDPVVVEQRHPVTFSGSGSEYFRIWIVNLLLTFVTFGIYYPWAKVRKLRYFYGNTVVGGHALDFHGDPRRMLRGHAIVGALFVAYSLAGQFSPTAGGIAVLVLMAIGPALLWAGTRFRLSQTSWRGLRFAFHGTVGGAYKAMWPLALAVLPFVVLAAVAPASQPGGKPVPLTGIAAVLPWLALLAMLAAVPLAWWTLKRWQHGGYALGRARASFAAGPGPFFGVFAKTVLLSIVTSFVVGIVISTVMGIGALGTLLGSGSRGSTIGPGMIMLMLALAALGYLALLWIVRPYFASRMQNLVWNRTRSIPFDFESTLRYRPMLLLSIKNWLLMIVTLGLYFPFAATAMAKMKLEAVTVLAHEDLDALTRGDAISSKDAAGDAAGDVFGIDLGL